MVSGGTVVITTANCEVVLDAYGFYVRCTSRNCTYVSGYTAAKFRARQWAEAHDNDTLDAPATDDLQARRRAYRSPDWLNERNNDPYGTPNGHAFWSTVQVRAEGAWRLFERDGWTYGYDTRHNGWWHFATPQEAAEHVAGSPAGIDMWA